MDLTLVPFGYKVSEDRLVDVQQVPSGKRCGCICPSCKAPLVARKGNKNVWHFAHDSKGELQNKLEKCHFSFYVSVRMMARQLIGNQLSVDLPKLEVSLSENLPFPVGCLDATEVVTEARTVILEDVCVDTRVGEHRVDLSGFISGYCLAFVFTHPGRDEFRHIENLDEEKTGVVAISLTGLRSRFYGLNVSNVSYSDILAEFITRDIYSKKWLFHPRLRRVEKQAKVTLDGKVANAKALLKPPAKLPSWVRPQRKAWQHKPLTPQKPAAPEKPMRFDCRLCRLSWTAGSLSNPSCRNCGASPLLVARAKILDDCK